jgi:indolepyruvate decarboxylase
MAKALSVGRYLLKCLRDRGVTHIFGVPGDYALRFCGLIEESPIRHIGTTREDGAGFAADAYARIKGFGAAHVTYCVGGFNITNPIAGAYAEKSPVVLVSGAPGIEEQHRHPLLHHKVRRFSTQREVFERITIASTVLDDPLTAYREVDRVLAAVERYKRPGYIELPRDMVDVFHPHRPESSGSGEGPDGAALDECIEEVVKRLNASKRPAILAGVETHRFRMQEALVLLAERAKLPVAATLLGKSVMSERHPLYLGVYEGAMGRDEVRRYIESADCLLMLGCFLSDVNLGIYTANLHPDRTVSVTSESVSVGRHSYRGVDIHSFLSRLLDAPLRARKAPRMPRRKAPFGRRPAAAAQVTIRGLFHTLNEFIADDMVVVCDVGDCLFASVDLQIHRRTEFLCPAYYTSMGFAVPGCIGAVLAEPSLRPLVLVGDGAFQMTGMELSTVARLGLAPIVVVLNNHGYSTERQIADGPFNDILNWQFSKVPDVLGAGQGFRVRTVGELRAALDAAMANTESYSILDVDLSPTDMSPALARLGERLGKRVKGQEDR